MKINKTHINESKNGMYQYNKLSYKLDKLNMLCFVVFGVCHSALICMYHLYSMNCRGRMVQTLVQAICISHVTFVQLIKSKQTYLQTFTSNHVKFKLNIV